MRPSRQAVRAFVEEALSENERQVLEAFADCGFSAAGAAELLGIAPEDVMAVMTAIRFRAANLAAEENPGMKAQGRQNTEDDNAQKMAKKHIIGERR